jgi:hypothetical protein
MIKNKLLLSTTLKFILSSSFVSIVITACLLINLFSPRTGTVVNGRCDTTSIRYHMCGCKSEAHSIDLCCCKEETSTGLPNNSTFTAFISSLACAGIPDQYTPITYKISLPDGGIHFPSLYNFNYIEWLEIAIPASFMIPPPYKPPKLT